MKILNQFCLTLKINLLLDGHVLLQRREEVKISVCLICLLTKYNIKQTEILASSLLCDESQDVMLCYKLLSHKLQLIKKKNEVSFQNYWQSDNDCWSYYRQHHQRAHCPEKRQAYFQRKSNLKIKMTTMEPRVNTKSNLALPTEHRGRERMEGRRRVELTNSWRLDWGRTVPEPIRRSPCACGLARSGQHGCAFQVVGCSSASPLRSVATRSCGREKTKTVIYTCVRGWHVLVRYERIWHNSLKLNITKLLR